jgi:alpha-mannosidase
MALAGRAPDEGISEFTYLIFPHPGDWFQGGVLAEAADLNALMPASACAGGTSGSWRRLRVMGGPIALSALKRADTPDGLVMRLYEPTGSSAFVRCEPPPGWQLSAELNILEEPKGLRKPYGAFGPHQVRTWLVSHFG